MEWNRTSVVIIGQYICDVFFPLDFSSSSSLCPPLFTSFLVYYIQNEWDVMWCDSMWFDFQTHVVSLNQDPILQFQKWKSWKSKQWDVIVRRCDSITTIFHSLMLSFLRRVSSSSLMLTKKALITVLLLSTKLAFAKQDLISIMFKLQTKCLNWINRNRVILSSFTFFPLVLIYSCFRKAEAGCMIEERRICNYWCIPKSDFLIFYRVIFTRFQKHRLDCTCYKKRALLF